MSYSQPANPEYFDRVDRELLRTGQSVARQVPNHLHRERNKLLAKKYRKRARSLTPPPTITPDSSSAYVDPVSKKSEEHFLDVGPTALHEDPNFKLRRWTVFFVAPCKCVIDRFDTQCRLLNLDKCSRPEAMVERAIAKCVQAAMEGSVKQVGGSAARSEEVTRIGITIESPNLEKGDITMPLRPTWMNTVQSMMRKFLKAEQSDRTNSLYDAPISIRVTTITGHGGRGPGDRNVRHEVAPNALIHVNSQTISI